MVNGAQTVPLNEGVSKLLSAKEKRRYPKDRARFVERAFQGGLGGPVGKDPVFLTPQPQDHGGVLFS